MSPRALLLIRPPCEERLARENSVYEHLGEHPQALTIFGLKEIHPGIHSLQLEMAPFGSVRSFVEERARPPAHRRLGMALDVAKGLSFLHSRRVFYQRLLLHEPAGVPRATRQVWRLRRCHHRGPRLRGGYLSRSTVYGAASTALVSRRATGQEGAVFAGVGHV